MLRDELSVPVPPGEVIGHIGRRPRGGGPIPIPLGSAEHLGDHVQGEIAHGLDHRDRGHGDRRRPARIDQASFRGDEADGCDDAVTHTQVGNDKHEQRSEDGAPGRPVRAVHAEGHLGIRAAEVEGERLAFLDRSELDAQCLLGLFVVGSRSPFAIGEACQALAEDTLGLRYECGAHSVDRLVRVGAIERLHALLRHVCGCQE